MIKANVILDYSKWKKKIKDPNDYFKKKLSKLNKILHLTLNDPEHQNTLSNEMISELDKKFKEASQDNYVKVIILSSTGKVFCAGHNLKDLNSKRSEIDKGKSYYEKIFKNCSNSLLLTVMSSNQLVCVVRIQEWFCFMPLM